MENVSARYTAKRQVFLESRPGLRLERTSVKDPEFAHFFVSHYPGSKGVMGRRFLYKIYKDDIFIGIIGGASAPGGYIMRKFAEFFKTKDNQSILNNNIYRLTHHEKNLGTRVLKLFRKRLFEDYLEKYGEVLLGLVTFVEPPRTGSIYKADNWSYLGKTKGMRCTRRKEQDNKRTFTKDKPKLIFAIKYTPKFLRKEDPLISKFKIDKKTQTTLF
jgi:hypothetical protein